MERKHLRFSLFDQQARTISTDGIVDLAQTLWSAESDFAADINIVLVSNQAIRQLNQEYLSMDQPTDVLAFPISCKDDAFEGELYIGVDQVFKNSVTHSANAASELRRVVAHGLLHFLGYDDKTERQREEMTNREDHYLNNRE